MNKYVRERLRIDAERLIGAGALESCTPHSGLRGRFRELLVQTILAPWLPPYAQCGTGMIVDCNCRWRNHTQEDIVIFDASLIPPVLSGHGVFEGVFPVDGVLARIEVKSRLDATALRASLSAASDVLRMNFATGIEGRIWPLPINHIFAYDTDLRPDGPRDAEWHRLLSITQELGLDNSGPYPNVPSPVTSLCVAGRGAWSWARTQLDKECRWVAANLQVPQDEILFFVSLLSNTCYALHAERHGFDPNQSVAGGIGRYIITEESFRDLDPLQ